MNEDQWIEFLKEADGAVYIPTTTRGRSVETKEFMEISKTKNITMFNSNIYDCLDPKPPGERIYYSRGDTVCVQGNFNHFLNSIYARGYFSEDPEKYDKFMTSNNNICTIMLCQAAKERNLYQLPQPIFSCTREECIEGGLRENPLLRMMTLDEMKSWIKDHQPGTLMSSEFYYDYMIDKFSPPPPLESVQKIELVDSNESFVFIYGKNWSEQIHRVYLPDWKTTEIGRTKPWIFTK